MPRSIKYQDFLILLLFDSQNLDIEKLRNICRLLYEYFGIHKAACKVRLTLLKKEIMRTQKSGYFVAGSVGNLKDQLNAWIEAHSDYRIVQLAYGVVDKSAMTEYSCLFLYEVLEDLVTER